MDINPAIRGATVPRARGKLIAMLVAVFALVFAVMVPVLGASRAEAADNPDITISDLKLVKTEGPGGKDVDGVLHQWNFARFSFKWDASKAGSNLRAGDSFWLELPEALRPQVGGVTPIKVAGQDTSYGDCVIKGQRITCTFNENVTKRAELGFHNFKGDGVFQTQAVKSAKEGSLNVKISTEPKTLPLPTPPGDGIVGGGYWEAPALHKGHDHPQADRNHIGFHLTIGTGKLKEAYDKVGKPTPFDATAVHELVITDKLAPGMTFQPNLDRWSLLKISDKNSNASQYLASGVQSFVEGFSLKVEIGAKTEAGTEAKVTVRGPLAADTNYMVFYQAFVDGPGGGTQPPSAGVVYKNEAELNIGNIKTQTEALYYNNAAVTIQMEPGFGTFTVAKSVTGTGSDKVPAGTVFPVKVAWKLPAGATVDTYPNWSAPKGTLSADNTGGTATMNVKLGQITPFNDGTEDRVFPVGTTVSLQEDLSGVAAPAGLSWGEPKFSPSQLTIGKDNTDVIKVTLQNSVVPGRGTFKVKKVVEGAQSAKEKSFTFTYDCEGTTGVVVAKGDGVAVRADKDFPIGTKCVVTEQQTGADVAGHVLEPPAPVTLTIGECAEKTVKFTNKYTPIEGGVELVKVDSATKAKLAGAEFGLFPKNAAGEVGADPVQVQTSAADGTVKFTKVPFGSYQLRETKPAPGYQLSAKTWDVQITKQGEVIKVGEAENAAILGSVRVLKVDADNQDVKLTGVTFALQQGGVTVYEATTDKNGVAAFNDVRFGKYQLVEVKTLENYVLDDKFSAEVIVDQHGKVVEVGPVVNHVKKADVALVKKGENGSVLAGAEFELRQGTQVVAKATTDNTGRAVFPSIAWGDYLLVETKAPAGYELITKPVQVRVAQQGGVVEVGDVVNHKTPQTPPPAPSTPPSPSTPPAPSTPPSPKGGKLAKTGASVAQVAPWLVALLAGGGAVMVMRKRRS